MGHYALKRALQGIITLFILGTVVFLLARVTGDPVALLLPAEATEADRVYMTQQLGLDRPYYIQYIEFITDTLRGDFGKSIKFQRPNIDLILERLPNTLMLVSAGFLLAVIIGVPLGVIAGSNRGNIIDSICRVVAVLGIAAPSFWLAIVLMQFFAVQLQILPAARMGGIEHYIMPAFSLSFFLLAGLMRLERSSMIEVLDSEFVKLARIKGVSTRMVIWKHCFRNALIPVLSLAGMYVGLMIGGAIVIETIFAWPGIGRLAYEGILYRDYSLVQSIVLVKGTLIVSINFATDVLYSYVDPRIRRE
ncbi:ABC transporter permease [Chloroflexota bacterium]